MNNITQLTEDLKFLLSFAPALKADDVAPGLSPMFYLTTTYEGDVALANRVHEISERYGIDADEIGELDEDEVNI